MNEPPVQVRQVLERERAAGAGFEGAWARAVQAVRARERDEWIEALAGTREAWARAYAREPLTPPERALDLVARGDTGDLVDLTDARFCAQCSRRLTVVHGNRRYCSERCRLEAKRRSAAAKAA